MKKNNRILVLFIVGFTIGLLTIQQYNAYQKLSRVSPRDPNTNPFHEIKILQEENRNLNEEVNNLEQQFEKYGTEAKKINALREDIQKNQILAGTVPVNGPGIILIIPKTVEVIWFIDLVNELFSAGAEAIALNDIRLVNTTLGFTEIGSQLLLHDRTVAPPFKISVIGDPEVLKKAVLQSAGIIKRLEARYPDLDIGVETNQAIEIAAAE